MTTYPTPCPSPVTPTIEESIQYWTDGELSITVVETDDELVQSVTVQVRDPGNWLLRVWFIDGDTITDQETLTPPTVPGIASFERVSDAEGSVEFEISNAAVPWSGRVCAAVVGRVNSSDAIVVGV